MKGRKMPPRAQIIRLARIASLLKKNSCPTAQNLLNEYREIELAEGRTIRAKYSLRTVYRDIDLLRNDFGCPVQFDRTSKTYYLTDKRAAGYKDWKRGILLSGHVTVGGKRYFLTKTGVVVKKQFATLNGEKYYFSNDGTMLRNSWITVNGRKFYLEKSGKMHKGLLTLNGKKYYFGWNGVLVANRWITADGKRYYADGSGELIKQY